MKSEGNRVLINATIMNVPLVVIILSRWLLNLLPNQVLAACMEAKDWFDRKFKNHRLRIITIRRVKHRN